MVLEKGRNISMSSTKVLDGSTFAMDRHGNPESHNDETEEMTMMVMRVYVCGFFQMVVSALWFVCSLATQ